MIIKNSILAFFLRKKFYSRLIKKNDLCFDIGANVGLKSKLFLSLGAEVIAFEPQSSCSESLAAISSPKFKFFPFAVGGKNENRTLHLSNYSEVATLSNKFIDYFSCDTVYWNNEEKVIVKSIDSLIEELGLPNYCKIDVEGYEFEIISNLNYKIPMIEFEFTAGFIDESIKIVEILCVKGYCFNYVLNEHLQFRENKWITGNEMILIIKSFLINRLHGNIFAKQT